MDKKTLLQDYSQRGMKIFPCWEIGPEGVCACSAGSSCTSPGKHPRIPSWTQAATSDAASIDVWHKTWPDANWAWKLERHFVIDFDPRNGGDEPYDFWEAYAGFDMPKTLVQFTGGEGHHVVFKQPGDVERQIRNGKLMFPGQSRPAPGVDVKGVGGYIMVTTSNHISGKHYAWMNWGTVPAEAPEELLQMVDKRGDHSSAGGGGGSTYDLIALLDKGVPQGEQNEQLYKFMCALRAKDESRTGMIQFGLLAISKMKQDASDPWTEQHVVDMVDRVRKAYPPGYSFDFTIPDASDEQLAWARGQVTEEIKDAAAELDDPSKQDEEFENQVSKQVRRLFVLDEAKVRFNTIMSSRTFMDPAHDPESDSLATLIEMPARHVVPRVAGMLNVEHNAVIAAAYKTGKTTLACNLAGALVDGRDFLGRRVFMGEGECVLHLNGEMSRDDLVKYYRGLGIENPDRIKIMNYRDKSLPLLDADVMEKFIEYCVDRWVTVVIVDSWRRLCAWSGLNENVNSDVERLTTAIDEFKRKAESPTFIAIAHQGRKEHEEGEEHARGATALDDWADARWLLTRGKDGDHQRYLAVSGRDVEMHETALTFDQESGRLGLGQGSRGDNKGTVGIDDIVRIVQASPGITKNNLEEQVRNLGVLKGTKAINAAITRAVNAGLIHTKPGANRSQEHYPGPGPEQQWAQNLHNL